MTSAAGDDWRFEGWASAHHGWLAATLVVVAGDAEAGRRAADRALGGAALQWSHRAPTDDQRLGLLRAGLRRVERRSRRSGGPVPDGWDPILWRDLLALPWPDRRAVALRVIAGLTAEQVDAITGTPRPVEAEDAGAARIELIEAPLPLALHHDAIAALPRLLVADRPEVADLVTAARRRRRNQRLLGVGAIAAVGVMVAVTVGRPDPVRSEATTTTRVRPGNGSTGIRIEPPLGYRDGQQIEVHLSHVTNGTQVLLRWCAHRPATTADADIDAACTRSGPSGPIVDGLFSTAAQRIVQGGAGGPIDCARPLARCFVMVEIGSDHPNPQSRIAPERRFAPLRFRDPDAPGQPSIGLDLQGAAADGQAVRLAGLAFAPGERLRVAICGNPPNHEVPCDLSRSTTVTTGDDGRFIVPIRLFRDVHTYHWFPCDATAAAEGAPSCRIQVQGDESGIATAPFALLPSTADTGIRPSVTIVTPGPYRLGQTVALRGTGFQLTQKVELGTCPVSALSEPTLQDCTYPFGPRQPDGTYVSWAGVVDDEGVLAVAAFPLPTGPACATAPGACVISGQRGFPAAFSTPLVFGP